MDIWSKESGCCKRIPMKEKAEFGILNMFSNKHVNVQSLKFRWNNVFKWFSCPRNITLGKANCDMEFV
jgi:hypothetical protein